MKAEIVCKEASFRLRSKNAPSRARTSDPVHPRFMTSEGTDALILALLENGAVCNAIQTQTILFEFFCQREDIYLFRHFIGLNSDSKLKGFLHFLSAHPAPVLGITDLRCIRTRLQQNAQIMWFALYLFGHDARNEPHDLCVYVYLMCALCSR